MKQHTRKVLSCFGILLLFTTGCLENPDMEYVTNKEEQGTLIVDNAAEDSGIPIVQQVNAPSRVNHTCEKVNAYTQIVIDAKVVIPDRTTIPVYTVSLVDMNEDIVEQYTDVLYESGEFYNREFGSKKRTTDELYEIIGNYRQMLDSAEITDVSEPVWDAHGNLIEMNEEDRAFFEDALEGYQSQIPESEDRLTYGSPTSYDFVNHSENVTYGEINGVSAGMDYEFQTAAYTGLHSGVEYDLTLYRDGVNSELRFLLPRDIRLENGYTMNELYIGAGDSGYIQKPNTCRYSEEEAVSLCRDFMAELGIMGKMEVRQVDNLSLVKNYTMSNEEFLGNKGYQILFVWGEENMIDCYSSEFDWGLDSMQYRPYGSEVYMQMAHPLFSWMDSDPEEQVPIKLFNSAARFWVLDNGIVDAWILNPLESPELLAENVRLLSFDQVLERGIAELEIFYGESGSSRERKYFKISTICLHYARMQSPDAEGEFAMIPVWDFKADGIDGESMITINAIDGTIFDRKEGY